ncbi:MAG: GspE/PulE family protein [Planctomycetota bacterium]
MIRPTGALRLLHAAREVGLLGETEPLLAEARRAGADPLALASERARLPREAFFRALAETRGLPFLDGDALDPSPALLARVPARLLTRKQVLPLRLEADGAALVATADPDDESTLETLRRLLGTQLRLAVAEPSALQAALRRSISDGDAEAPAFDAVAFLDDLLHQAWLRRASDVHLDPQPQGLSIRLRVDGHLAPAGARLAPDDAAALISRVKVLGGLDIAERRCPQDGSFSYAPRGEAEQALDVRLATIPTRLGERATLRLLGVGSEQLGVEDLGFAPHDLGRLREALEQPHGMVLLTGPTGSGKTTTLYAALREVAAPHRNVLSVEDPVERLVPGVSQVQVDRAGKVTFASALRALLRHDPNVLMVGEIRDAETADVAVKAAMTGHLVLSSLHTNRAAAAPSRLVDLGCQRFLVASVLRGVIAQRLARRLCERCAAARAATPAELAPLGGGELEGATVHEPRGCAACVGSGYRGRIALVEGLWVDEGLRAAIDEGASEQALERQARAAGLRTLQEDALAKVLAGATSVAEGLLVRS